MDKRWHELAEILVHYSTQARPNERVMIAMREVETLPLTRAVYEACVKAGAHVQVQFLSDLLDHALMRSGSMEQIQQLPQIEAYGMEWADVYIALRGAHNLYEFADISADVLAKYRQTMGRVSSLRWEKTRWCIVRVPNPDFAQQAETDYDTILEMFFNATLRDWEAETASLWEIAEQLNQGTQVHLVGRDTDLRFSLEGRKWLVGDGRMNMPDGEIFTAPVIPTVNGHISFEWPGVLGGRLVPGIRLEWQDGELIHASASQNEDFLHEVLAVDPGASKIGEFAIGTNYSVDRFCKDIFFDEKIGGTIHIALGRAYPACGGTNASAIHWDIIKDTRQEGILSIDSRVVMENGQILLDAEASK